MTYKINKYILFFNHIETQKSEYWIIRILIIKDNIKNLNLITIIRNNYNLTIYIIQNKNNKYQHKMKIYTINEKNGLFFNFAIL
jgi:hypothetical protein